MDSQSILEPLLRKLQQAHGEDKQLLANADVVTVFAAHPAARKRFMLAVEALGA